MTFTQFSRTAALSLSLVFVAGAAVADSSARRGQHVIPIVAFDESELPKGSQNRKNLRDIAFFSEAETGNCSGSVVRLLARGEATSSTGCVASLR